MWKRKSLGFFFHMHFVIVARMPPCEGLFSGKSFSMSLRFNAQDMLTATGIVQSNGGTCVCCVCVYVCECLVCVLCVYVCMLCGVHVIYCTIHVRHF